MTKKQSKKPAYPNDRIKELPNRFVTVRLWTLRDKDSLFRSKEPDSHIVEVAIGSMIIREIPHTNRRDANKLFNRIVQQLEQKQGVKS